MGGFKRLAVPVLITVAAYFVGHVAGQLARAETEPVIVGVPRDLYPEYAIGSDDRRGGFGVDLMNAVAKRAGLSVTYHVFETWRRSHTRTRRHRSHPVVVIPIRRPARSATFRMFSSSNFFY